MNVAIAKAKEVIEEYGNDLDKVLEKLNIQAVDVPLAGRLKELYFGDVIVLMQGLSDPERRELIAHALGHHFLHAGNHYAASRGAYSWDKYQERQADVFAAYYLVPELKNYSDYELAEEFKISERFVNFRKKLFQTFKR